MVVVYYETNMTSNTSPSPLIASASSVFQTTGKPAYLAFDGVVGGTTNGWRTSNTVIGWIKLYYGQLKKVNSVKLTSSGNTSFTTAMPKRFSIYGSNNDVDYELLTTVDNQIDWKVNETREYSFNNTKEYSYFRLDIEENNGYSSIFITEIIYGYEEPTIFSLIKDSEGYKTYDNGWKLVSTTLPSELEFYTKGISKLKSIPSAEYKFLNGNFDVYTISKKKLPLKLIKAAVPNSQVAKAIGDINLVGIEKIDSINLKATGMVGIGISFDGGVTFKSYKNGGIVDIISNSDYMTVYEINSLTSDTLELLRNNSNNIRFNYLLQDDAEIDNIEMKVSMQGYEKIADTKDYVLSYDQVQKKLIYNITKSGTYSVNYVDGSA